MTQRNYCERNGNSRVCRTEPRPLLVPAVILLTAGTKNERHSLDFINFNQDTQCWAYVQTRHLNKSNTYKDNVVKGLATRSHRGSDTSTKIQVHQQRFRLYITQGPFQ